MIFLFIGGPVDGQRLEVDEALHVQVPCPEIGMCTFKTYQYIKEHLNGSTALFTVYVPRERKGDGDWIMRQLTDRYQAEKADALLSPHIRTDPAPEPEES